MTQPQQIKLAGPKGLPLVGSALQFINEPYKFVLSNLNNYGDIVPFKLGPVSTYQLNTAEAVEHVLVKNMHNYVRGSGYNTLKLLMAEGLAVTDGATWKAHRKILAPQFRQKTVERFVVRINHCVEQWIESLEPDGQGRFMEDSHAAVRRFANLTFMQTFLSVKSDEEITRLTDHIMFGWNFAVKRAMAPLKAPMWVPTPSHRKFKQALRHIHGMVSHYIDLRSSSPDEYQDFLLYMMDAKHPDTEEKLGRQHIIDEFINMYIGGNDTIIAAMTWSLYLLAKHQQEQQNVYGEVMGITQGSLVNALHLHQLAYTRQCIKEAMRMYPPIWSFTRSLLNDDEIYGVPIKAGEEVLITALATHYNTKYFEDPFKFDPNRFSPQNEKALPKYAWQAFGGGQHICIGLNHALLMVHIMVARVVQRYHIELVSPIDEDPTPMGTTVLYPKEKISLRLIPR